MFSDNDLEKRIQRLPRFKRDIARANADEVRAAFVRGGEPSVYETIQRILHRSDARLVAVSPLPADSPHHEMQRRTRDEIMSLLQKIKTKDESTDVDPNTG